MKRQAKYSTLGEGETMIRTNPIMAEYNKIPVVVVGGYHSVKGSLKGYIVEITFDEVRGKVLFSDLIFPDQETEEDIFQQLFKITIAEARQKGHKKGLPNQPPKIVFVQLDDCTEDAEGLHQKKTMADEIGEDIFRNLALDGI